MVGGYWRAAASKTRTMLRMLTKDVASLISHTPRRFSKFNHIFSSFSSVSISSDPLPLRPKRLIYLFLRFSPSSRATLQFHSFLITSGSLLRSSPRFFLLFNTLVRLNPLCRHHVHTSSLPHSYDTFVYSFLLHCCADWCFIAPVVQLHALSLKLGFQSHVYVGTALLRSYSTSGYLLEALVLFDEMPVRNTITWNVVITGLTKWGELRHARSLFDQMPQRTVISWTAVIDGYTRRNRHAEAVALFRRMVVEEGFNPTEITLLTIFPSISNLGWFKICQLIHSYAHKKGFDEFNIRITNTLLDAYAKCGCIESSLKLFDEISRDRKNLVSWTSIISALAMHGKGKEAMERFERMERDGFRPNQVTFLSVLNACSHGGLIEEGLQLFTKMVIEREVEAEIKHYGCVIDMLGRAGRLEEAEKIALGVPSETLNVVVWRILLGACSFHGNMEMGERVVRRIMATERRYGGDYVLMSNILAGAGRYSDGEELRRLMDQRNAVKVPGFSLV